MKNHAQNEVEKLVPDPFLKITSDYICGSLVIISLKFPTACIYCMLSRGLSKYF